jgi:lysophospholipase L1-like esterase
VLGHVSGISRRLRVIATISAVALAAAAAVTVVSVVHSQATAAATGPQPRHGAHAHLIVDSAAGRLLIVGASYTQGIGAVPATNGYAYLVGRQLGMATTVDGIGGTGFVNPGPYNEGTFGERIARQPESLDPTVVMIQCGRNDLAYPRAQLREAATAAISDTHRRFPHARIVLLGPIPGTVPIGADVTDVTAMFTELALSESMAFINPLGEHWMTIDNTRGFTGDVPDHPNNAGYAYIAGHVVRDLRPLVQAVTPYPSAASNTEY